MSIVETNIPPPPSEDDTQLRDLFLFRLGNRTFGVPADEVEGTVEGKQPAPLPHSPAPILGIVYARGRMLTVVDPLALTNDESPKLLVVPQVISLRGDEHLALAAETVLPTITVSTGDIENTLDTDESEGVRAVCGILQHGGETISVLDSARLFEAAVRRKERRRRRF